eukprot:GHRR01015210.1.p1 GENE.GHRR01015210.1~~GHRR01015210.1.p1  ORF type:complete len:507 (+),score=214.38 GHRR01015210.1:231-1751(+)
MYLSSGSMLSSTSMLQYQRSLRFRGVSTTPNRDPTAVTAPAIEWQPLLHGMLQEQQGNRTNGTQAVAADNTEEDPCPQLQPIPAFVFNLPNAVLPPPLGPYPAGTAAGNPANAAATRAQPVHHGLPALVNPSDSDDDPPPGIMDTSDVDEDENDMHDIEHFYTPLLARPAARVAAPAATTEMATRGQHDTSPAGAASRAVVTPAIRRAWRRASRATLQLQQQRARQRQQPQQQQQEQVVLGFSAQQLCLSAEQCRPPASCSYLRPGMVFEGHQRLVQLGVRRREEQWRVNVTVQDVDLSRGYVAGSMQAQDVPGLHSPIETFWEGQVIDDIHHTFHTRAWGACKDVDERHWSKFHGWASIRLAVADNNGRCGQLERHPYIYMRWKEQFFVTNHQDCSLTIAGFYYMAMERRTGQLQGFYFDPNSCPYQELNLRIVQQPGRHGSGSSSGASSNGVNRVQAGVIGQPTAAAMDVGTAAAAAQPAVAATVPAASTKQGAGVSFVNYSFA